VSRSGTVYYSIAALHSHEIAAYIQRIDPRSGSPQLGCVGTTMNPTPRQSKHPGFSSPSGVANMTTSSHVVEPFDWAELVPKVIHPLKVAIIEAIWWIGRPLAPSELRLIFDKKYGVPFVSYHVKTLVEAGVLAEVERLPVRGTTKTTYFLAGRVDGLE